MLKDIPIKYCIDCGEERLWEHTRCSECGATLANTTKPNPEYIVQYDVKQICNKCGRSGDAIKDHTGKFCPFNGGKFTIVEHKEEIILKGFIE